MDLIMFIYTPTENNEIKSSTNISASSEVDNLKKVTF